MALNEQGGAPGNAERDPGLDRLYQAAGREEPARHLDAAILAAARREVGARPRPLSALRGWRVPVSIAAVVVLSVSLVTLVHEEGGEQLVSPGAPGVSRPAAPPAPGPAPTPELPKTVAPPDPAPSGRLSQGEITASASRARRGASGELRRDRSPEARATGEEAGRTGPPPVEAAPDTGRTPVDRPPAADDATRPATATMDSRPSPAAAASGTEATGGLAAESPRPAPAAQAKRAAKPMAEPRRERQSGFGEEPGVPRGTQPSAAPSPAEPPRARTGVRGSGPEESPPVNRRLIPLLKELEGQPPQKWLDRIEEMRRQGRLDDAEELMSEFKRRFPYYR